VDPTGPAECRSSARLVHLLATLLKEGAERASQCSDYRDRQISMNTSRIRPPAEIGFLICEETVSSCVVVQNTALPNVLISVCSEWCSSRNAAIAQKGQRPTVTTLIVTRWSRSRRCVGVAARKHITKLAGSGPQHSKHH